jgi:hypothetical protein
LSPLPVNEAGSTLVVTGTAVLLVRVARTTLPSCVLVIVVTICDCELVVINVNDSVDEVSSDDSLVSDEELVDRVVLLGVRVDVVVMTVVEEDPDTVIVEEVVMMVVSEEVSEEVADEVVSLLVAESVGEIEDESLVPPVLSGTF